ncbi:MAG: hypothetical protein J3K34DRAFT_520841 [Monoraphidium minutum]|nr:MAG: hypothetical protein J3K34DRAFT_520841 [Monoraphidium minutum]
MSQQAATQLRPQHVTNLLATLANAQQPLLTAIEEALSGAADAAILYSESGAGSADRLSAMRSELAQLLRTQNEAECYSSALHALAAAYAPRLGQATDFAAEVEAGMERAGAGRFDPEAAPAMREFDEEARAGGGGGAERELGDDEDLIVEGGAHDLLNATCPFTLKSVMELADPVEDDKGYVYERAALVAHIRLHGNGWCDAPFPGVNHRVELASLTSSKRVERLKRRQRLGAGGPQRGAPGGNKRAGKRQEVVIDL